MSGARRPSRRGFLAGSAAAAASVLTGCGRVTAGGTGYITTATYFTSAYTDVLPSTTAFIDTAAKHGGVSFDMYDSGKLLGADQLLPGLMGGVVEIMFTASSYLSSSYPVLGAVELPFGTDDYDAHTWITRTDGPLHELINTELAKKNVRMLGSLPLTFGWIWTVDRPVHKPGDIAGLRIRTAGAIEGETVRALGGAPVTMSSAEAYSALKRGTIDGVMGYLGTIYARDMQHIVRYGTQAPFGAYTIDAFCRADWYTRQNTVVKDALHAGGVAMHDKGTRNLVRVHSKEYLPAVKDAGVQIFQPSPRELAAFRRAIQPVYDNWRRQVGDARVSGRAIDLLQSS